MQAPTMTPSLTHGAALAKLPWQDRPAGSAGLLWRFDGNPILARDATPASSCIFSSAVVPWGDGFAGVFRCDTDRGEMNIHTGVSDDAIHREIEPQPISFVGGDPDIAPCDFRYDPRVTWIDDRFYLSWCNGYHGPTIGLGYTWDFVTFYQLDNAFLPSTRNGVLFPRRIGGKYALLSRPGDMSDAVRGDIFYSESPDLLHWGHHRRVLGPDGGWQSTRIGTGPTPIETSEGWLLLYHGALNTRHGYVHSFGAALLDLDRPWKVLRRGAHPLLAPHEPYERDGEMPDAVLPCSALVDAPGGRIAVFYGAAESATGIAFGYIGEITDWLLSIEN